MAVCVKADTLSFDFAFDPGDLILHECEGGYVQPELKGEMFSAGQPGYPQLPVKIVYVRLPEGAQGVRVESTADRALVAEGVMIFPEQEPQPLSRNPPRAPTAPGPIYSEATPYPDRFAILTGEHLMRGQYFISVQLNPVTCEPANGRIYLTSHLRLEVFFEAPATEPAADDRTADVAHPLFEGWLNEMVVNPAPPASKAELQQVAPLAACDYLIITSAALSNTFARLAEHRRTTSGVNVRVLTVEHIAATYSGNKPSGGSDTQTKIRNCISNYVHSFGTTYVVLGGDDTVVPARGTYAEVSGDIEQNMPTDLYYSGLDGTWDGNANNVYGELDDNCDLTYDVIVGRIPVQTAAQANNYINKVIAYETSLIPSGWNNKLLLGGDMLWSTYSDASRPSDTVGDGLSEFQAHNPVSDAEIWERRLGRDGIRAYAGPNACVFGDTLTSWDASTPGDYAQISSNMSSILNQGWQQMNFDSHGSITTWALESGIYVTSYAAALTNLTSFIYTEACLTAAFDIEVSLSEAFLRNANGGAVCYMGCSRYGWGSPGSYKGGPSMDYAYKYYEQVYSMRRTHVGLAFAAHKQAMVPYCGSSSASRWIQFGLNLQGDPLLPLTRPSSTNNPFSFRAFALTNSVVLRWSNPLLSGLASDVVRIEYRTNDYPAIVTGTPLYVGNARQYQHVNPPNGHTCYYTIWVSQDGINWTNPPP